MGFLDRNHGGNRHKSVMVANMMGILLAKQAASCTIQPRLVSLHFSSHWHEIKAAGGGSQVNNPVFPLAVKLAIATLYRLS